jgi:hypothetical protein
MEEISATCDVSFKAYPVEFGLGHIGIYLDRNLAATILDFVRTSIEKAESKL